MIRRLLFFLFVFSLSACDKPLRLPYITPELQHWPQPYKGVAGLRLQVFNTGKVTVPGKFVYRDGSLLGTRSLDILVFVIEHPRQGLILVGTGLNRKIADNAERYLGTFPASLGNFTMAKDQDIVTQLTHVKLSDHNVRYIILPDLRFDHTGELESFPSAQPVVTSVEHNAATEEEAGLYLSKEYDKVRTWRFINFVGAEPLGTFRAHRDLFGDGSVLLIDVAGATTGGLAVLIRLPTRPVLLCGNLAWTKEHYLYARLPSLLFDREAWWEKVWRLKKFKELAQELVILPDHDWPAVEVAKTKDMILHSFPATETAKGSAKTKLENTPRKERKSQREQREGVKKKSER